jgi:flagellar FlgN protein
MNKESERYWRLLERRLSLLDALTKTLAEARADFIALDLEAMRGRIREQEQFCGQIRALDQDISQAQVQCARLAGVPSASAEIRWPAVPGTEPALTEKIHETMRRVAAAQGRLQKLNNSHHALLRRSRRTVHVLLNLFQSHAPTYAAQVAPANGTICEERV